MASDGDRFGTPATLKTIRLASSLKTWKRSGRRGHPGVPLRGMVLKSQCSLPSAQIPGLPLLTQHSIVPRRGDMLPDALKKAQAFCSVNASARPHFPRAAPTFPPSVLPPAMPRAYSAFRPLSKEQQKSVSMQRTAGAFGSDLSLNEPLLSATSPLRITATLSMV